jgi:hypothetical protein
MSIKQTLLDKLNDHGAGTVVGLGYVDCRWLSNLPRPVQVIGPMSCGESRS